MPATLDIVVCAHNETDTLRDLFDSMQQQTSPPDTYRLIFVDNASTDGTMSVAQHLGCGLRVEYVRVAELGKSIALNAGLARATTQHVAFLDADCRAAPTWVERILGVLGTQDPDLLGGPYYPYYRDSKPVWYRDEYNTHAPFSEQTLLTDQFLSGCNLVCRRSVLEKTGGFNARFQIAGRNRGGGEDTELQIRARRIEPSVRILYDPDIRVFHLTRKSHMSSWRPCSRSLGYGIRFASCASLSGRYAALKSAGIGTLRICWRLMSALFWRNRERYPYLQNWLFEELPDEMYQVGQAIGVLRQ